MKSETNESRYNNPYIRYCNGEEEYNKNEEKETKRDEQITNKSTISELITTNNKEVNISESCTKEGENKEKIKQNNPVTNPYIRKDVTKYCKKKFGRELSTKDGRTEIYLPKYLKEAIKKIPGFNLSAFVREKLIEFLNQIGIKIEEPEPDLLILVRCPHCNGKFVTSTVKTVRCDYCKKPFRVYRKNAPSRIEKIVKGSRELLWKKLRIKTRVI